MTTDEVLNLLAALEKKVAVIACQAEEACEQVRYTVDQANRVLGDIERMRQDVLTSSDTEPIRMPKARVS